MKWPWSRRAARRRERTEVRVDLAAAQRKLAAAHAVEPEVSDLVRKLALMRERNNFASMIEAAFREHR